MPTNSEPVVEPLIEPLYVRLQRRTNEVIEKAGDDDRLSQVADISIALLIVLNIFALMLETVQEIGDRYRLVFDLFDAFSLLVFTSEYVLRIWSCTTDP